MTRAAQIFLLAAIVSVLVAACERPVGQPGDEVCCGEQNLVYPQSVRREVDLVFVIDNSGSMAGEQAKLRSSFASLMTVLQYLPGGLPNVHVGVTSTDLGTSPHVFTYCNQSGGDNGELLTGNCLNPVGAPYIVDVEPQGCEIVTDGADTCLSHDCTPDHCAHEPSTQLVLDGPGGCPRCRNYAGESLNEVFSCIADLGTMGCGFEQPLEAMHRALDPDTTANAGFLRDYSILGVVIITDEDDCSAPDGRLYDNTQTDIDSLLGPLTSYRCFEFSIECDENTRTAMGLRTECVPREDPAEEALMTSIGRYVNQLEGLRDGASRVVAAIAGPVEASASGVGHDVEVIIDDLGNPDLQYSCENAIDGAVPAIRIYNVVASLNEAADLNDWAYTSVCSGDYEAPLRAIGERIVDLLYFQCLPAPIAGCSDPGVDYGVPQAAQHCEVNSQCVAQCHVTDVFLQGEPHEERHDVAPCLEIAPDGTRLPDNTDRSLAYAQGHPDLRDPALPVSACWHIRYEPQCTLSNGAEILVARREDPPPKSLSQVACLAIARDEKYCHNYADDDEDCLTDMEDPCCLHPETCTL